jgi:cytochrome c biogenesis protein CcmG/thiol:disulfide interchange protein DsbE
MARFFVALSLILGFLGTLAFGITRDPFVLPSALIDSPAPEFALEVMSPAEGAKGQDSMPADSARLTSLRGNVVVLNFWASWCLACRSEHAALSEAADRHRSRGVQFFGVLYQDTPHNARRWITEMGGQTYPTLLDPRTRTAIEYGVYGVPETYFISPDGTMAYKHIGPVTPELLDERIGGMLNSSVAADTSSTWQPAR